MGVRSRSGWPRRTRQTTNPGSAAPAHSMVIIDIPEHVPDWPPNPQRPGVFGAYR